MRKLATTILITVAIFTLLYLTMSPSSFFVVVFAVAILFSIGLHELGHLVTAKKAGMKVEQYFIGFGPKIWSTHIGETEYGVKALPIGGFVRIAGMNPFEEIPPEDRDRVFGAKKPGPRAIVLAAGSFTHFLLAFILVALAVGALGMSDFDHPTTKLSEIGPRTPAAIAGLKPGDTLVAIDGINLTTWKQAQDVIHARASRRVRVDVKRGDRSQAFFVTLASENPDTHKKIGFLGVEPSFPRVRLGPIRAIGEAGTVLGKGMWASLDGIRRIFSPSSIKRLFKQVSSNEPRTPQDPATLVGIAGQAGGIGARDPGQFLYLIAAFNIFVGVANLLPLPPLDGGHLAVVGYEKVTRRKVDMRKLIPVAATVISIFGSLFLLLLYLDIVKPLPQIPG